MAQSASTRPASTRETASATQPGATVPGSQPVRKRTYTAPGAAARQVNVLGATVASSTLGLSDAVAKDAAQARVSGVRSGVTGISGVSSLGAPQAITASAVVSQPGLQRGFPLGLGLAPRVNLFTRQVNPLSGPNGRGSDLIRAGFFRTPAEYQGLFRR